MVAFAYVGGSVLLRQLSVARLERYIFRQVLERGCLQAAHTFFMPLCMAALGMLARIQVRMRGGLIMQPVSYTWLLAPSPCLCPRADLRPFINLLLSGHCPAYSIWAIHDEGHCHLYLMYLASCP